MCSVCGPEKPPASQVLPMVVLANVSHFLWKEYCIVINSFGRSEVHSQKHTL